MDSKTILEKLHNTLPDFHELGVTRLAVFGSVARGDNTQNSDIDILIRMSPDKKTFDNFMDIKFMLEDMFPESRVDLVLENTLKPAIRDRVLAEAEDVA